MKKAYELSVLAGCEVALIIFDSHDRHYQFASHQMGHTLMRYINSNGPDETHTSESLAKLLEQKGLKEPEGDEEVAHEAIPTKPVCIDAVSSALCPATRARPTPSDARTRCSPSSR